jgi:hypothetical protein
VQITGKALLVVAVSAKQYQSYVMVRKALFMLRNELQGNKPQFFCSMRDTFVATQSEPGGELASEIPLPKVQYHIHKSLN